MFCAVFLRMRDRAAIGGNAAFTMMGDGAASGRWPTPRNGAASRSGGRRFSVRLSGL
jgi:hypothetical protein